LDPGDRARVVEIASQSEQELDFDAELSRPWARIWTARDKAAAPVAAFLLAWAVADEMHIINVATHPSLRRRGAARALLNELLTHARANQVRLVLLEVRRSNRAALSLYRSHGFSAIGVRRGYYADNAEDAIEMMLAIDPSTGKILPGRDEIALPEV
jgi:ribosomal-protein-alanine N-acetyltransferase